MQVWMTMEGGGLYTSRRVVRHSGRTQRSTCSPCLLGGNKRQTSAGDVFTRNFLTICCLPNQISRRVGCDGYIQGCRQTTAHSRQRCSTCSTILCAWSSTNKRTHTTQSSSPFSPTAHLRSGLQRTSTESKRKFRKMTNVHPGHSGRHI